MIVFSCCIGKGSEFCLKKNTTTSPSFFLWHFWFGSGFGDLVIEKDLERSAGQLLPGCTYRFSQSSTPGVVDARFLVFVKGKKKMKGIRNQKVRLGFANKFETTDHVRSEANLMKLSEVSPLHGSTLDAEVGQELTLASSCFWQTTFQQPIARHQWFASW